jgi:DNA-binding MarR family transcriptional regulator
MQKSQSVRSLEDAAYLRTRHLQVEEVGEDSRQKAQATDAAEAGLVRLTMMQQYVMNVLKRDGPHSAASIQRIYMKATGSTHTPAFLKIMEKRGFIHLEPSSQYTITPEGLEALEAVNRDDATMAQPRRMNMFERPVYVPTELNYRGKK